MAAIDAKGLRARMAAAVEVDDFETAARLRDELEALEAAAAATTRLRRQAEGAMGLGTDQPAYRRPEGWTPPRKPDLGTAKTRTRRGQR